MHLTRILLTIVFLSLLVSVATNLADDTATTGVSPKLPVAAKQPANSPFGKQLFAQVTEVSFSGPAMPANSDGTIGALSFGDGADGSITIYEKYIVLDSLYPDGARLRTVYVYDTLAKFVQVTTP